MAQSAQIQKMSHKHEDILNFLLNNPLEKMGNVAAHFGVTFSWLSTIVHSHAFQNQLRKRQDMVFDSAVLAPIEDKLGAAAQVTLDAYLEKVPMLTADQLISANDKLLNRLGYGTKSNGTHVQINGNVQVNHVDKAILEEARNRIGSNKVGASNSLSPVQDDDPEKGIEIEGVVIRTEGELQANK